MLFTETTLITLPQVATALSTHTTTTSAQHQPGNLNQRGHPTNVNTSVSSSCSIHAANCGNPKLNLPVPSLQHTHHDTHHDTHTHTLPLHMPSPPGRINTLTPKSKPHRVHPQLGCSRVQSAGLSHNHTHHAERIRFKCIPFPSPRCGALTVPICWRA